MKDPVAIGDPISSATRLAAAASERGHRVIEFRTFSKNSEYYQRSYDGSLFDSVVEYADDDAQALHALRDVKNIIVGADSSVQIVERLNLFRGQLENDPSRILARCNKVEQARHFQAAGLSVVPQQYIADLAEGLRYAGIRGFPQVLKPPASGGTNNVMLACNPTEFREAFVTISNAKSLYERPNGGVLVMDYVNTEAADEFVVDAVSCQGHHVITDIWKYEKVPLNGTPAMYRSMRLVPWHAGREEISFALRLLDAAGYRQGASHSEIWRLSGARHLPVEVGFRLPGLITQVSADATGRDQVELTLDSILDPREFYRKISSFSNQHRPKAAAVSFLAAHRAGFLTQPLPTREIESLRSYHSSGLKASDSGQKLGKTVDLATIVGWVALCHEDWKTVDADLAELSVIEQKINESIRATPDDMSEHPVTWPTKSSWPASCASSVCCHL